MSIAIDELTVGRLTKRVRIEKQVTSKDAHGSTGTPTYALRAVIWAEIVPLTNREAVQAASVTSALGSALVIWYRNDIAITDRVVLGSRVFQIISYQDPTGQQVELRLICTERQA